MIFHESSKIPYVNSSVFLILIRSLQLEKQLTTNFILSHYIIFQILFEKSIKSCHTLVLSLAYADKLIDTFKFEVLLLTLWFCSRWSEFWINIYFKLNLKHKIFQSLFPATWNVTEQRSSKFYWDIFSLYRNLLQGFVKEQIEIFVLQFFT